MQHIFMVHFNVDGPNDIKIIAFYNKYEALMYTKPHRDKY